jgi:ATP-dependent Clp protease ATP-binding subunit ClpA
MFELEETLQRKLEELRVRIETPDADTLFLRNVPANEDCFSKSRTNLLIKRPHAGQPFIVCVDEDLEYTGDDSGLLRVFTAAHRQQGWRVIYLDGGAPADTQDLIENALCVLGFDGADPVLSHSSNAERSPQVVSGRLLAAFATDLTVQASEANAEPTIGRDDKVEEVVTALRQWQARLPVIVGPSGVGKTNLLLAVAGKLRQRDDNSRLLSVDLGVLMAGTLFDSERENLLSALLNEARENDSHDVLALEHIDLALVGVPRGQWLLAQALDQGVKLVGTLLAAPLPATPRLSRRVQLVELTEPWPEEMATILFALRERIAGHHQVRIDDSTVHAVIRNADSIAGSLPARAINLLDMAVARAAGAGRTEVSLSDIYLSCSTVAQATGPEEPAL